MKKNSLIFPLLIVGLVIGYYVFKHKKESSSEGPQTVTDFKTKADSKGNYTHFYKDGDDFIMAQVGPLIRTMPVKISKQEFENNYKL